MNAKIPRHQSIAEVPSQGTDAGFNITQEFHSKYGLLYETCLLMRNIIKNGNYHEQKSLDLLNNTLNKTGRL